MAKKFKFAALRRLLIIPKYIFRQVTYSNFNGVKLIDKYYHYEFKYLFASPKYVRDHRRYFRLDNRGFGEDVFHAAWFDFFMEFKPVHCLEIGVYRGQTTSLWSLIAQRSGIPSDIWGVTPLYAAMDTVSEYPEIDYLEDMNNNFRTFNLEPPQIIKGLSTEKNVMLRIKENTWDLIYIDGGHDYDVVYSDYQLAKSSLKQGGFLCMDDSSLYFNLKGRFKGHPGPSTVVTENAIKEMIYLFTVGHLNFFQKS